jgi:RIO-like serine/threonine protein kinase
MVSQEDKSIFYLGSNINDLKLIGQGYEGKAYLLPENKVLKVFYTMDCCKSQLEILQKGQNSIFFPTVFDFDKYSIIMDFIDGCTLSHYLRHDSLNKVLSLELVKLIDEFKNLNFTRLDMRPGHIFVQANYAIKIIDPRGSFEIKQPYPLLLLKGLKRHGVLEEFFNDIKCDYPDYYSYWSSKIS